MFQCSWYIWDLKSQMVPEAPRSTQSNEKASTTGERDGINQGPHCDTVGHTEGFEREGSSPGTRDWCSNLDHDEDLLR